MLVLAQPTLQCCHLSVHCRELLRFGVHLSHRGSWCEASCLSLSGIWCQMTSWLRDVDNFFHHKLFPSLPNCLPPPLSSPVVFLSIHLVTPSAVVLQKRSEHAADYPLRASVVSHTSWVGVQSTISPTISWLRSRRNDKSRIQLPAIHIHPPHSTVASLLKWFAWI